MGHGDRAPSFYCAASRRGAGGGMIKRTAGGAAGCGGGSGARFSLNTADRRRGAGNNAADRAQISSRRRVPHTSNRACRTRIGRGDIFWEPKPGHHSSPNRAITHFEGRDTRGGLKAQTRTTVRHRIGFVLCPLWTLAGKEGDAGVAPTNDPHHSEYDPLAWPCWQRAPRARRRR